MNYYIGDFPSDEIFAPKGWICPKCGRVYSPTTPVCFYCGGNEKTITSLNTTPFEVKIDNIGGSDYWDDIKKTWTNIKNTQSNY